MSSSLINKVLVRQFGAIKPPWIDKETFYKLIFNFCDRWCERCKLSRICRLYQKEKEREKRFIKQGIDPKSTKAMFLSICESLEEAKRLLENDMKRFKIKITEEDYKKFEADEERKDRLVKNNRLTQIATKLSYSLVKLVEDIHYYFLEEEIPEEIKGSLEILTYYMHFFSVKIRRAVFSEIEEGEMKYEDITFDSKNSAFLSYVAIVKIINALENINNSKKIHFKIKQKVKKIIPLFYHLNAVLKERFKFGNFFNIYPATP
ncbi:MAG: hypothetical protein NC935_08860 [Candidatus Omnitrophica bacterium]|nr:hypothetical protein [Candidatus Omnitrophota bacterium]